MEYDFIIQPEIHSNLFINADNAFMEIGQGRVLASTVCTVWPF